jgi:Transposase DDE domain
MNAIKAQDKYKELEVYFSKHLKWHQARIKFFVLLITALCKMQTVNFERLATAMESCAQISSCLRRIQRFFALFAIDKDKVAHVLFSLLPSKTNLLISIDRTNWQFGKTNINIFMLSVCYQGIAFPLLWQMLAKKGNSNAKERISLIKSFIDLFGKACIKAIVADREFIGEEWISFLQTERLAFHIRIKDNMWLTKPQGGEKLKMSWLLQGQRLHEVYHHPKLLCLDKALVYVSGMKLQKGEYLIIVSYDKQQQSLLHYKERWQIETMFKAFKTKGFHIEDTHLTDIDRIDKLVAVVSIAFTWAYKAGLYVHLYLKPIAIKKHQRKAYSFFKYGLNFIANALLIHPGQLITFINVLSCT